MTEKTKTKINVYGTLDCFACKKTDEFFRTRNDLEYRFYDLNIKRNENNLHQLVPDFNKDQSTPVIQKCTADGKCVITRGFRSEDYE